MTIEADNVAILTRAYQNWHDSKGAGVDSLKELFDNDVRFTSLANAAVESVAFTAHRNGKDEFFGYIDGLTRDWTMNYYRIDEFIAQGDRVVAIGSTSWRNRNTGKDVETPKIDVWRLKDGKAVEYSEYYDTAKLIAAATP